jgi:hypothetical protein
VPHLENARGMLAFGGERTLHGWSIHEEDS